MGKHPSLTKRVQQEQEKTLREELLGVAEKAVREHIETKLQHIREAQNDPDILAKLDAILMEVKRKNGNLELEKQTLLNINKELGYSTAELTH